MSQHAESEPSSHGLRLEDGTVICAACGEECEWERCQEGDCEEGWIDAYEEDPLWYDPGDLKACPECDGEGGTYFCPTRECATCRITRITSTQPGHPHD